MARVTCRNERNWIRIIYRYHLFFIEARQHKHPLVCELGGLLIECYSRALYGKLRISVVYEVMNVSFLANSVRTMMLATDIDETQWNSVKQNVATTNMSFQQRRKLNIAHYMSTMQTMLCERGITNYN